MALSVGWTTLLQNTAGIQSRMYMWLAPCGLQWQGQYGRMIDDIVDSEASTLKHTAQTARAMRWQMGCTCFGNVLHGIIYERGTNRLWLPDVQIGLPAYFSVALC